MGLRPAGDLRCSSQSIDPIRSQSVVPTSSRSIKKKILATELFRGVGGILINQKGERFCNELGTRDYVSQKTIQNYEMAKGNTITPYESFMPMEEKSIFILRKDI